MLAIQIVNGISYGLLLFFAASGLLIIFGMMNLANLAHGSFYMLGGYICLSVLLHFGNFWLALVLAPVAVGLMGLVIERLFLRHLYHRDHLDQVLLTLGFAYVVWDVSNWIYGGEAYVVRPPNLLTGSVELLGVNFPVYRLAVLAGGLALASLMIWFERATRYGAIIRAGVTDPEMLRALGINVGLVFTGAFCVGAALAGLAGVVGSPMLGLYPDLDFDILMLAIIVVVVGGLGSLFGTLASSILIGVIDSLGRVYLPEFSLVMVFLVMALVLLWRPTGLFGISRSLSGGEK